MQRFQNKAMAEAEKASRETIPEYFYDYQSLDHFNHQDQRYVYLSYVYCIMKLIGSLFSVYSQRYFKNDSFWAPEQSMLI